MDHSWTLDLLSTRGLDQSILLTVLLGLWIMLAFSEVLGWVFIGVVVPGYLASVMVIAPTSACAILCEAVVTLVVSRTLAVSTAKTGVWTQFFGRDRFFLIVLVSIWVRQLNQSLALPALESFLRSHGYPSLTLTEDFSSIGLVLVPLTANMFWRLNLARGLIHCGTLVGLTYVLLRWVLLPYTNLTDASLVLLYEDSAIDFMSNAKSYIVLLVSAYLASLANLKYGWDFGGILIAALLSLLWWSPIKLALTILEAMLLYGATLILLRLPLIRKLNLEGSRKITIVFTYSFCLKCIVGICIGDSFPGLKVTDLFAFGYLMSSILVVRMMVIGSARRVVLPVMLTSLIGFVVSNLLGLWIAQLSGQWFNPAPEQEPTRIVSQRALRTPQGVLGYASSKRSQARDWHKNDAIREQTAQQAFWQRLARNLAEPSRSFNWKKEISGTRLYHQVLASETDKRSVHLIHPGEDSEGNPYDGSIVLVREGSQGPMMVVQWPERVAGLAQTGWIECQKIDCNVLVLIGERSQQVERGLAPTLSVHDSKLLETLRQVRPIWHVTFAGDLEAGQKVLHLDSSDAQASAFLRTDLTYRWNKAPESEALYALAHDRVLRISQADRYKQIAKYWDLSPKSLSHSGLAAYLEAHRKKSNQVPLPPSFSSPDRITSFSATELRIIEQKIVRPLLDISQQSEPDPERLSTIAFWSNPLGIRINWLPACEQLGCFVLSVDDPLQGLVWALAFQSKSQDDIEVPRPQRETGTLGLGLALFQAHELRSLLVHTGDWSYDPTFMGNTHSAYHAIHQALDRHSQNSIAIILRGVQSKPSAPESDDPTEREPLLIGLGYPQKQDLDNAQARSSWYFDHGPLGFLGAIEWSDSSLEYHRYSGAQIPQVRYSRLLGKKQILVAWLTGKARSPYTQRDATHWMNLARALGDQRSRASLSGANEDLPVIDESDFLVPKHAPEKLCFDASKAQDPTERSWSAILDRAERLAEFRHSHDLFTLRQMVAQSKGSATSIVRGARSGTAFLAITWHAKQRLYRALITLGQATPKRITIKQTGWGHLGPWPSLAMAQLQRYRTMISLHCN